MKIGIKWQKTEAEHLARSPAFSDHPGALNISIQHSYITKTATFTTIATFISFTLVFVFLVVVEDHTANLAALYSRLDELRQAVNISRRRAARMNVWHLTPLGLSAPPGKKSPPRTSAAVLFCSLAVLDPRVGHNMDVLSPFIPVLCHSHWLFHGESCPRLDVVHLVISPST